MCINDCTMRGFLRILSAEAVIASSSVSKCFTISKGVFRTFDDTIALQAHDYATSSSALGWIDDGVIEKAIIFLQAKPDGTNRAEEEP